jgi:hypothetical protein
MASRGGGPKFSKWGSRALYRWRDLLEWAESRLSEPTRSTSELDFRRLTEARSPRPVVEGRRAPISGIVGEELVAAGEDDRPGGEGAS